MRQYRRLRPFQGEDAMWSMQIKTTPWELLSLCVRKMRAFTVLLLGAGTGLGDVTGKVVVVTHWRGCQHPDFQSLGWAEAFTDILAELKLKALFLQLVTDTRNFMHVSGTIKAYTYTCMLRIEHLFLQKPRTSLAIKPKLNKPYIEQCC